MRTSPRAVILASVIAATFGFAGLEAQAPRRVIVEGAFPKWRTQWKLTIDESTLDVNGISAISAAPTGPIVVADGRELRLVVFDATGARQRVIGQKGAGPGEFQSLSALGWLGDTLVVMDRRQRRLSLFAITTGALLKTLPWPVDSTFGRPDSLITAGAALYAVAIRREGPMTPVLGRGMRMASPSRVFTNVRANGVATSALYFRDSTEGLGGSDCLDGRGTIHILDAIVRDHGSMRAMTPTGQLVTAIRDSFALVVQDADLARGRTLLTRQVVRAPMTNALWDSVAKKYVDVTRTAGSVTCTPPLTRPAFVPVVRALAADDEGQLWVEVSEKGGSTMYILRADGTKIGTFALPAHDARVAWVARHNTLYTVVADADGLQSIRVYSVGQ